MKRKDIKIRAPASFFAGLAQQKRMLPLLFQKKSILLQRDTGILFD